jgi:heme oxygenase
MLEKQEYATGQDGARHDHDASRLPLSLSGEINAATRCAFPLHCFSLTSVFANQHTDFDSYRTLHTNLNRLITSRLPLALPPHSTDPTLYTTGLLHFAHIFLTFESLWADLLRDYAPSSSRSAPTQPTIDPEGTSSPFSPLLSYLLVNPYDSPSLFTSTLGAPTPPSPQLAAFLQSLRPRGLIRSSRLKRDLEYLLGVHPTDLEVLLAKYPGDKVAQFCTHIRKSVNEKPWTLVSYAWCFYMAIFSGGRWIRGGLLRAPPSFWPTTTDLEEASKTLDLQNQGLSFWHFPGPNDGEDIKAEFKLRLAAAETLFTPDERIDIIEEAKQIFKLCASLVDELDEMIGTDMSFTPSAAIHATPVHNPEVKISPLEKSGLIHPNVMRRAQRGSLDKQGNSLKLWIKRPEVSGTVLAMGCLACVVIFRLQ